MTLKKVLFLDFDGVLNHEEYYKRTLVERLTKPHRVYKEIVRAMPWLFDNEALWFDPKSNKSKRLVLRDFINSRSQQ